MHGKSEDEVIRARLANWGTDANRVERRSLRNGRVLDIYRTPTITGDVISIHVDVTDSVRKAEELERQRLYMVSLLENTTDGIALLDRNGRFVMYNDRLLELYDVDPQSVYWGMDYRAFAEQFRDLQGLPADQRAREIESRHKFAFDPEVTHVRRELANGRTLNINKRLLPDGGCVMTYRDITAELKREQDLIDARVQAEESNRHKSEFVARMSHEMRTPLNGVLGVAALLEKSDLDDRAHELIGVIKDSGKVLLRLIDDILDLSRLDAGTFEVVSEDFELPALIAECVRIVEPSATEKGLELRVIEPNMPIPALRGDTVRIKQILLNLLTNAVKFTEHGHIEIEQGCRTGADKVSVYFGVSDTGVGIENDKLDQIFNRFYQIDGSVTRKYGGAGLGLAITQKLVETMGGTIQVASQKGHGTTFRIRLMLDFAEREKRHF
jgi:signal transduction histidine kinase